jgi:hypothetical protein
VLIIYLHTGTNESHLRTNCNVVCFLFFSTLGKIDRFCDRMLREGGGCCGSRSAWRAKNQPQKYF